MKKKRSKRKIEDAEGDMMPMVDVIFLLIIFFVLITEITQAELEEMVLPEADMANPDSAPPPGRLVINVVKAREDPNDRSGEVVIARNEYGIGSEELIELLRERAERDENTGEQLRDPETGLSDRLVLVRCDRRVKYEYFQQLMTLLAHPKHDIGIWQVEIAIAERDTQ